MPPAAPGSLQLSFPPPHPPPLGRCKPSPRPAYHPPPFTHTQSSTHAHPPPPPPAPQSEVERQMPAKHEHVVKCRLSKRQRTLYEDYVASSEARAHLSNGFLGMLNVLMSLRKVRHRSEPDLARPDHAAKECRACAPGRCMCLVLPGPGAGAWVRLRQQGLRRTMGRGVGWGAGRTEGRAVPNCCKRRGALAACCEACCASYVGWVDGRPVQGMGKGWLGISVAVPT